MKYKTSKKTCTVCRGKGYILDQRNQRKIKCFACTGLGWITKVE
jgi:DnaJ-class molecular chaperone